MAGLVGHDAEPAPFLLIFSHSQCTPHHFDKKNQRRCHGRPRRVVYSFVHGHGESTVHEHPHQTREAGDPTGSTEITLQRKRKFRPAYDGWGRLERKFRPAPTSDRRPTTCPAEEQPFGRSESGGREQESFWPTSVSLAEEQSRASISPPPFMPSENRHKGYLHLASSMCHFDPHTW